MTTLLPEPIQTADALLPLVAGVAAAPEVYLDTEADSLHHYFDKVCLIQITLPRAAGDEGDHYLIDTLAGLDLRPLFSALRDKLLVLHGSDYDLRVLRRDFTFVPAAIFDTMHAARLAGHTAFGLDALVRKYLGLALDHKIQKADWSRRPLTPRLLKYAVEDTAFLPRIARALREELEQLGRTEWHRQLCGQLIELSQAARDRDPDESWRIKGSFHLDRKALAILRELWRWRDAEAQRWDRPPFMVLGNEKLLELARWASHPPADRPDQGPELPRRWPPPVRRKLEAALARAAALPESQWPSPPARERRPASPPGFFERLKNIRAARDAIARDLRIDPAILAPQAMLEQIAALHPRHEDSFRTIDRWLPWQTEVLGGRFLEVMDSPG
jgi:ribonuclease D